MRGASYAGLFGWERVRLRYAARPDYWHERNRPPFSRNRVLFAVRKQFVIAIRQPVRRNRLHDAVTRKKLGGLYRASSWLP